MSPRLKKWLWGGVIGAGLAALWLQFGLPLLLAHLAANALHNAGFPAAKVEGVNISTHHITVDRVRLTADDSIFVEAIRVEMAWQAFRARDIHIGLIKFHSDSLIPPGFNQRLEGGETAGVRGLPFRSLEVARIDLRLGEGDRIVALPSGRAQVIPKPQQGTIEAALVFDQGHMTAAGAALEGVQLEANMVYAPDRPLELTATLEARDARLPGLPVTGLQASLRLQGETVIVQIATDPHPVWRVEAEAAADLNRQHMTVKAQGDVMQIETIAQDMALSGAAHFKAAYEGNWGTVLRELSGAGDFSLQSKNLSYNRVVEKLEADIAADFTIAAGLLTLKAAQPWTWRGEISKEVFLPSLAALGNKPLRGHVQKLGAPGGPELQVQLVENPRLQFSGEAGFSASQEVYALLQMKDLSVSGLTAPVMSIDHFSLEARQIPYGDLRLSLPYLEGQLDYRPDAWSYRGRGAAKLSGAVGSLILEAAALEWQGRIQSEGGLIGLYADHCIALVVPQLSYNDVEIANFRPPCLQPAGEAPLLSHDMAAGTSLIQAAWQESPLALTYRLAGETNELQGNWPKLAATVRLLDGAVAAAQTEFSGLNLRSKQHELRLENGSGTLDWRGDWVHQADIKVDEITSLAAPAVFAPLELSLKAGPGAAGTEIEAVLGDKTGALIFEAQGPAGPESGELALNLYPISFFPEVREFGDVFPVLAGRTSESSGMISFTGVYAWTKAGVRSQGTLSLADLGFATPAAQFSGLSGDIGFDSLYPLTTAGSQHLTVTKIDAGIPLSQGMISFQLTADQMLNIEQIQFSVAQGRLYADPFILDLSDIGDFNVTLVGEDLRVEEIFELSGIEGLSGSGKLSGRVPLKVGADGIRIADGILDAGNEGRLTYDPANPPAFLVGDDMQTTMLRQVLKNFQYEKFSLKLDGLLGEEQNVRLETRGRNPDFLEGHPVELNVNLHGPLANVLQNTLTPYSLPEALEKDLQNQEQEKRNDPNQ